MMSLAWPLFRVTEQAALAAWPQTGCGDKNKIDGLAVTAMRQATAIADFAEKGKTDPLFKELARLVEETHGIWNEQAEKYLLAQFGVDIGEAAQ